MTVNANLNNGFIPAPGNSFSVLSYGSETGSFASTVLPPGFVWTTNYGSTTYTIAVTMSLPAGSVTNLVSKWQSGQALLQFSGARRRQLHRAGHDQSEFAENELDRLGPGLTTDRRHLPIHRQPNPQLPAALLPDSQSLSCPGDARKTLLLRQHRTRPRPGRRKLDAGAYAQRPRKPSLRPHPGGDRGHVETAPPRMPIPPPAN